MKETVASGPDCREWQQSAGLASYERRLSTLGDRQQWVDTRSSPEGLTSIYVSMGVTAHQHLDRTAR